MTYEEEAAFLEQFIDASDGGTITGTNGAIQSNGTKTSTTDNGNTVINIFGGTIDGSTGLGIYHPQDDELSISGGTIEGYSALYESNPQKNSGNDIAKVSLSVTGGTFNAINGGTVAAYSQDKTGFIIGGTLSIDPSSVKISEDGDTGNYVASGYCVSKGTTYTVAKHNMVSSTTGATCTENGKTVSTCANCGETTTTTAIAATGHTWTYASNGDGTHTSTCSVCGATSDPADCTAPDFLYSCRKG